MYNSQYYTCEQIDQRLLQGYLDDYNSQNNTNLTKEQFLSLLFNTIGRNNTVDNLVTQIGYYECDTAGATAAKAITVANYALFAGGSMKVKFINKNTANNATLNINNKGAKALYYQGKRASSTNSWDEGEVVEIYYDGTSYYANNVKGGSGSDEYAVIYNGVPVLDTVNNTFTLPASVLYTKNGRKETTSDIVFAQSEIVGTVRSICFLILNTSDFSHKVVVYDKVVSLSVNECVIALVDYNSGVIRCNTRSYIVDGRLSTNKLTDTEPENNSNYTVNSNGIYNMPVRFCDYCRIAGDNLFVTLNTTDRSITIPSGMVIYVAGTVYNVNVDLIINRDTSISETTVFIIFDSSNGNIRQVTTRENGHLRLSMTEGVLFHLNWTRGIISAALYQYYLNNTLITLVPQDNHTDEDVIALSSRIDNLSFMPMASITAVIPELDTVNRTFTIPAGSLIISNQFTNSNRWITSIETDLVWNYNNLGVAVLVLNVSTKETKTVNASIRLVLEENEIVVAIVRWRDRIFAGNFTGYYLNKKYVNFKSAGAENISSIDELNLGYWKVSTYHVGDILDDGQPTYVSSNLSYKSTSFDIKAGNTVYIAGLGGSSNSRLYMIVNKATREVTHIAGAGVDTRVSSEKITVAVDSEVYISFTLVENEDYKSWYSYTGITNKVQILENNVSTLENNVSSLNEELDEESKFIGVPCMFNPKVDLQKDSLKILDIGNSYTKDAMHYLPEIINAAGLTSNYSLYRATRGSGSFRSWYRCYHDIDTSTYDVLKWSGDTLQDVPNETGFPAGDGTKFRQALENGHWDVVMIHQVSQYANDYSVWEGNSAGGYLKELIRIIRKNNPNAAIGFYIVHSYRSTYVDNTEHSSLLRWQHIRDAVKQLMANYGIDFVIPYGTAVQNLRQTSLNDSDEFTTDGGLHMADGIGDYCASCSYFQSVFAPRFNTTIIGNTWRKTDFDETLEGVKNINDANALLAQKAAYFATYNMFTLTNPEDVDI